ncbi:MAG: hypothetical protein HKL80_02350 [Acidimicrobiales bacterium]|nr:hypothetical protein [Acidimicrobiales bacterium]
MLFQLEALEEALRSLGAVLDERRTPCCLLFIGGSSLLLLKVIDQPTGDLDVIGLVENGHYFKVDTLPGPLAASAAQVGQAFDLPENWLKPGPASLMDFELPPSWEDRIEVHLPSLFDKVCFKLYDAVDRSPNEKHYHDLQALQPSPDALPRGGRWAMTHDPSTGFKTDLLGCLSSFGMEVENGKL